MRRDSFNVLFFIKKTKLLKNGEASVCMRILQQAKHNSPLKVHFRKIIVVL